MSQRSFELSAQVPVAPEVALDFLADLAAHRGMHPYLESASVVARGVDDDGGTWADWRVVERPRLGPLRYRLRFPARMMRASPLLLIGTVDAAPRCQLITVTSAAPTETGASVLESCLVVAPAPVVGYMARHARLAHERTYALLARELAGRG